MVVKTCEPTSVGMPISESGAAAGAVVAQHLTMLDGGNSGASRPAAPRQAVWQLSVSVNEILEPNGASANARTHCPSTVPYALGLCACHCTEQPLRYPRSRTTMVELSHLLRLEKRRSVCGLPCLARAYASRERLTRAPILIAPLPGPCGWWQWSGSLRRPGPLLTPSHAKADRTM